MPTCKSTRSLVASTVFLIASLAAVSTLQAGPIPQPIQTSESGAQLATGDVRANIYHVRRRSHRGRRFRGRRHFRFGHRRRFRRFNRFGRFRAYRRPYYRYHYYYGRRRYPFGRHFHFN